MLLLQEPLKTLKFHTFQGYACEVSCCFFVVYLPVSQYAPVNPAVQLQE